MSKNVLPISQSLNLAGKILDRVPGARAHFHIDVYNLDDKAVAKMIEEMKADGHPQSEIDKMPGVGTTYEVSYGREIHARDPNLDVAAARVLQDIVKNAKNTLTSTDEIASELRAIINEAESIL